MTSWQLEKLASQFLSIPQRESNKAILCCRRLHIVLDIFFSN